jgi:erythromycin esterase-like protein
MNLRRTSGIIGQSHTVARRICLRHWIIFALLSVLCCTKPDIAAAAGGDTPLAALVADVCQKQVVLLGEDGRHGSGRTLELKVEIVKRLVDDCGFSAIFFESPIYDFLDLERSFAAGTATPAQLADAIGGLWSTTSQIDPLVSYIFQKAAAGRLRAAGLDPQLAGATQLYSQRSLPAQLGRYASRARRDACETELHRLTNWQYDEQNPYDDSARNRLRACAKNIQAALAGRGKDGQVAVAAIMANNVLRYLDFSDDDWAPRDRAMYENFAWHRARLPKNAKIIVWSATVHGQNMSAANERARLGFYVHKQFGTRAATIGFSALSGSYGRTGKPLALVVAAPDSLEHRVLADTEDAIRYVDRKQLVAFGVIAARALSYDTFQTTEWSKLLDGIVILREEHPPQFVRSAKPQQLQTERTLPST